MILWSLFTDINPPTVKRPGVGSHSYVVLKDSVHYLLCVSFGKIRVGRWRGRGGGRVKRRGDTKRERRFVLTKRRR